MSRIYLIGARGSGKTVIGRQLAKMLGHEFVDLDEYLSVVSGKSIEEIVAEGGWAEFRKLESEILIEASRLDKPERGMIVATGGGIILDGENRKFLRRHGVVIWLKTDAQTLLQRLEANPLGSQRPALTRKSPKDEICQILKEREPLYAGTAHHIVDCGTDMHRVCSRVAACLRMRASCDRKRGQ